MRTKEITVINISIIMPLYNAEKYLPETLQSILMQTYKEYELICINDGSTDSTIKVLKQFQILNNRIKILENTTRLGAAVSRNKGIAQAEGKYITFLDGDDVFDQQLLELSFAEIERYNADIVMYEYMHVPSECIYEKKRIWRSNLFIEKYCKRPFSIREFEPIEFMNWSTSPCNKLYRKSFISSNNLWFQSLTCANDVYYVSMALLSASKLVMLNDRRVMLYARDHNVATRISYNRDPMCVYKAIKKIGDELVERSLFEQLYQYYYCAVFYNLCSALSVTKDCHTAKVFYFFLRKEGIDNLIGLCDGYDVIIDNNIYSLLQNFKQFDFDSKWYSDQGTLRFYLNKNRENLIRFFQSCTNSHHKVAVWGAGKNGKILLDFLKINKIPIAEVIDKDNRKQGKEIKGYIVKKPEDVFEKIQVIVISSRFIYNDDIAGLKSMGIRIINIEELVELDYSS